MNLPPPPMPEYPLIEGFEPQWAMGESKPICYLNPETGETRETPDYATWRGDWVQQPGSWPAF